MSELQPPVDTQTNGGDPPAGAPPDTTTPVAGPPKRQRRPSVRLGDIGVRNQRRTKHHQWKDSKSWKTGKDFSKSSKAFSSSKRVRTNWDDFDYNDDNESLNFDGPYDDVNDNDDDDGVNDDNDDNVERNGVRVWLNQLGLGRYAHIFEVHEVDDEVLPLLTLEDLKDMGINAVGSRRKMFSSIQKLGKGFS
uniref:protein bicaudal C homolog 1-A-like n=1 Tax=Erigeron canadensis TaxID=72917 RepID=UPI001CB89B25|nr:protein bicaudal C homolog 1-A-like [Erigeron canadensis]